MNTFLPRFALRLLVPAVALGAIAVLGEPLPAEAAPESPLLVVEAAEAEFAMAVEAETTLLRARADAAAEKALHQSASQMRWFVTLPATSRRCFSDTCSS